MSSVRHIHGITPFPPWLTLPRGPIGDHTANSWPFRGSVCRRGVPLAQITINSTATVARWPIFRPQNRPRRYASGPESGLIPKRRPNLLLNKNIKQCYSGLENFVYKSLTVLCVYKLTRQTKDGRGLAFPSVT